MRRFDGLCLTLVIISAVCRTTPSAALPEVTMWLVQPPGELVAFEPADFSRIGGVRIPPAAFSNPDRISINGRGQILIRPDAENIWVWDGTRVRILPALANARGIPLKGFAPLRQWLLGNDGHSLFVLESESRQVQDAAIDSLAPAVRVLETDLDQVPRREVVSLPQRWCWQPVELVADGTTCDDASVWAPGGVVRNFFMLDYWAVAKNSSYRPDDLHYASRHRAQWTRDSAGWSVRLVSGWGSFLDASSDGSTLVGSVSGAGCCGWNNESSDETFLATPETTTVLLDEWRHFGNSEYDVAFYTANAKISPGRTSVAYSIHTSMFAGEEIRLSSEGHPDTVQLARVRRTLAELPIVEVVESRPSGTGKGSSDPSVLLHLDHAELLGWVSDREVLLLEKGRVVAYDVPTGKRRESGLDVRTTSDVFVIWK